MNDNPVQPVEPPTDGSPEPLEGPILLFDLKAEIERLHRENTEQNGHSAKTLTKYSDFRVALMVMRVNAQLLTTALPVESEKS